jgi:flagellar transcriptional activator FlhC
MTMRSVVNEAKQIERAISLIKLGARLQVLESETSMSYERLLKLYKEVLGRSPSKGMLPFSTDWFMTWQQNIHSSLFLNIYDSINKSIDIEEIDAVMKAYQLYLEQIDLLHIDPVMSITRAWRLVRFVDAGMLCLTTCTTCHGKFVQHTHEITKDYVCGLCKPPARAGKTRALARQNLH